MGGSVFFLHFKVSFWEWIDWWWRLREGVEGVATVVVVKVHSRGQHACERGFEVVGMLKTHICVLKNLCMWTKVYFVVSFSEDYYNLDAAGWCSILPEIDLWAGCGAAGNGGVCGSGWPGGGGMGSLNPNSWRVYLINGGALHFVLISWYKVGWWCSGGWGWVTSRLVVKLFGGVCIANVEFKWSVCYFSALIRAPLILLLHWGTGLMACWKSNPALAVCNTPFHFIFFLLMSHVM